MPGAFIDPRHEIHALRRVALLLERVLQDGRGPDAEIEVLLAGVGALRRAATAGRVVHDSAIERLEAALARTAPMPASPASAGYDRLWCSTLAEVRELVRRLSLARATAAHMADGARDLSHAAS